MQDTPYRAELQHKERGNGSVSTVKRFAIMRSGYDPLCYCDDVTFAYRLVELLNEDEHAKRAAAHDRHVHQVGADQRLADTAA